GRDARRAPRPGRRRRSLGRRRYRSNAGSELPLGPLRGLAGLFQAGLLALDGPRVAGEEALALERHAQLRVGVDERPRDAVPRRASLSARTAAVEADPHVVAPLGLRDLERGGHLRAVHLAREVVLERAPVDPPAAVARPQDHARDRGLALAGALV